MHAPEALEVGIVERLHAKGHAVDAGTAIAAEALGLDAGGIGLEGYFGLRVDAPGTADGIEDGAYGLRLHERGSAAPEEHAPDRPARNARRRVRDLALEGAEKTLLIHRLVADMAVEVAIRAFGGPEGPMDIDAKAHIARRVIDHGAYMAGWRPNVTGAGVALL